MSEIPDDQLSSAEARRRVVLLDKVLMDYRLSTEDIPDAVELYYDAQRLRILHFNKDRTEGDRAAMRKWFNTWLESGENLLKRKITQWVESDRAPAEAQWAYAQHGIGPVLAAGLNAYINVEKARYVSSVWKFAGLAPGFDKKVKGQKLPYCARLKVLCFKLGDSFVKVSGKEGAVYGKLYVQFKSDEVSRNENGLYAHQAQAELTGKKWKGDTVTKQRLEESKLSDAHLHRRACRRTVKVFLSHYWLKGREARGLEVNGPYVGDILGHGDIILPVDS